MKILIIDIETSPALGYVWALWDQRLGLSQVKEFGEVICFAAQWHDKKKKMFFSVHHDGKEAMVQAAHDLLSEADVVVGYNSKNFDMKHLHREFILAGLTPPAPYKNVDLMHVVKANFRFTSNKLDHVVQQLGIGAKVSHTGFDLWLGCMSGDEKAWALMKRYNLGDISVTKALYDRLLPWITSHPNHALHNGTGDIDACTNCGSVELQRRGYKYTNVSKFIQYVCKDCGKWVRGAKAVERVNVR